MDRQRLQAQRAVDPGLQPAVPRPEVYRQHLDPRVPGELDLLFAQTQGNYYISSGAKESVLRLH